MTVLLASSADVLLTIGWGVLMTAATGIVAAVGTWASQFVLPAMPAGRRALFVLAVLAGSLAFAWAGPAAELLPNEPPAVSLSRTAAAGVTTATPLAISDLLPSSLRAGTATSVFVGTGVQVVAVAWMLLAAALLVRLAGGLWIAGRIRRRCPRVASGDLTETAERLRARLGIRGRVEVLQVEDAGAPFSMGWREPVVVMPRRTAEVLSPGQLESLLAHELGHIRRADYIVGLFQAALDAVCCLSPGHRRLSDEVRTLREQACDDLAVSLSGDVRTYATALGSVAHHRASAPLTAAMCAVDRHVAARIRRLLGDDGTPPVRWYRWTGAAALLVLGIATSVAVHAAASMPAGRWAPAAASQDAMRVHLGRTGIPIGFAPRQSGSPVVLSEVAPSASYVFDSVLVRNASPSRLTSVTFAAVVEWRSTPGTPGLPVLVVEAEPSSVTLAPGSSATVPLKLLPIRQALALKTESDGLMQVFLTAVATVTDAAAWSMPLRDAATHRDAMGLPAPTVPRSMVSVDPPTGPPSALCRTDESDSETSPGGIFAIRGEHGRLAKCVNGGWIEVSMDAPRYPPQKHEVQPGGRFHVTPGTVPVATPERRTAPDAARPRPMPEAAETKGAAVADTGGEGIKFRLTGGGGQTGGSLDGDFCCPEYLSTVPRLIQQHWNPTQQVAGQTLMTFTIQRNGTLSGIEVERSSGYIGLDQTAKRALLLTRQVPPLPAQYTEATLTVHLMFQYER